MLNRRIFTSVLLATLCSGRGRSQSATFELTLYRQNSSAACTSGYLAANGQIICYTLELPWNNNAPFISSIPVGTYPATLRYDHADKWRIEFDVPGRPNVQIHTGNTTDNTAGCILVGMQLSADLCSISAGTSKPAYDALRTAFYGTPNPVATPNKQIVLKIPH